MAIRLIEEYPNRVGAPTADYPHGVPRNKSTPTATDGTPFEQSWFRDQEGFFQGLMETAGITPSGEPDTVLNSDYLDALNRVTNGVIEVDMAGAADVSLSAYQGRVAALKLTGALAADVDLIVPDTERMYWIIDETTGDFSVTVKTAAGTGVKLFGEASAVRSDGTNVVPFVNGLDRRVIYVDTIADLQALNSTSFVVGQAADVQGTGLRWDGSQWVPFGAVNVAAFGAVANSVSNQDAALSAAHAFADSFGVPVEYNQGFYTADAFTKSWNSKSQGNASTWRVSGVDIAIPEHDQTTGPMEFHVDPVNGNDTTGNGISPNAPYKTIQAAWDSAPSILSHYSTINLADGDYVENPVSAVDQPRPAILWGRGKTTTIRSYMSGSDIISALTLKGNSSDRTAVTITAGPDFTYGFYFNKGNIGIQDVTLRSNGSNVASGLLVAHRTDTYIHALNVLVDGVDVSGTKFAQFGVTAESGGQVELANDCLVTNSKTGVATLTDGDNITISGESQITSCDTGALVTNGLLKLALTNTALATFNMIDNCTTGLRCVSGRVEARGQGASNRAVINSTVSCESSNLDLVFADTEAVVTLNNGSSVKYDSSNFQDQVRANASSVWLRNANSYTNPGSPNNDNAVPVSLLYGSTIQYDGTNNISGSAGGPVSHGPRSLLYTGNSQVVPVLKDTDVYRIDGNGANRLTCQIDSTGVEDGRTIRVDGDTWGVEFTSGTHMDMPSNFSIGNAPGQYTGAVFTMRNGKWRLNGIGLTRS